LTIDHYYDKFTLIIILIKNEDTVFVIMIIKETSYLVRGKIIR